MENFLQKLGIPVPEAAATYATQIDASLGLLHAGMILIFVLWTALFVYCLVRFRQSANKTADHHVHKWAIRSFLPDVAILSFEIWLIFSIGIPIWAHIKEKFPADESANHIVLVAEQFAWNFQYPGIDGKFGRRNPSLISVSNPIGLDPEDIDGKDDVVTINQLLAPLEKPTVIRMTSKDVIHSFFIPEFRSKQDIVPGLETAVWFEPTKTGQYQIVCSQLCGLGHYRMKGSVDILSSADFESQMKTLKLEQTPQ